MIQERTVLLVGDNSGARRVICIRVLGGSNKRYAEIGGMIKVAVKEASSHSKVKKGEVFTAVVIRTKKGISRRDGSFIRFDDNSCVLLNNSFQPIGTRIFGPVTYELKTERFMKIVSLAKEVF